MLSMEEQLALSQKRAEAYDRIQAKARTRAKTYYKASREKMKTVMREAARAKKIEREAHLKTLHEATATMLASVQAFAAALNALDPRGSKRK